MVVIHRVSGLTNAAFVEEHARAGRVGLVGGASLIDRAIALAQRPLARGAGKSAWSHAFLFQGRRADGRHWVIESDLDVHRKHVRLGVQENRADKYADEAAWPSIAILDFGLTAREVERVHALALELVATRVRYSVRELLGTLVALHRPNASGARAKANPLAREHAIFCSAFVQHVFRECGVDLVPGVDVKHTAPEDLARSPRAKTMWLRTERRPDRERAQRR
ncbi:MAG: hypothetical protein HZA53_14955 [Planctomycetes bacterium]|nr:hypothetical protein [Planctomycetota bacterium]